MLVTPAFNRRNPVKITRYIANLLRMGPLELKPASGPT